LESELRESEVGHSDFLVVIKSCLDIDATNCQDDLQKRYENLLKAINKAIAIDLGVKEEPIEIKEEFLSDSSE
jgi:hypothetical protein